VPADALEEADLQREPVPSSARASAGRVQMSPHNKHIRKLIARALSPYLLVAMLLWWVEATLFLSAARAYFPEVDLNSWACIGAAAPPLLVALLINFFVGTVLFVRAFTRRKGRTKAVRYLFPEVEAGKGGMLIRVLLRAAGAREDRGSGIDFR
jgi:hypothetical protein